MSINLRNIAVVRSMWWLFAAALIYLFALKLWVVHYLPGNVTGTRIKWVDGFYVAIMAELVLLVVPLVCAFLRPKLAGCMFTMTVGYFLFCYFAFWPNARKASFPKGKRQPWISLSKAAQR